MKPPRLLFALVMSWATISIPGRLQGQDQSPQQATAAAEFFELSLAPGVQLRGEDAAIQILRLGFFNRNISVRGLDIGLVNQSTGGISKGLQLGIVSVVDGDFGGAQFGIVNWAQNMRGIQVGLINIISGKESFQFLPIVNWSF